MSDWQDRIDYPELGVGWVRLSKSRPVGRAASSRQVDHMYVAPNGARFRSIKQATEFIESGGTLIQQKPVSSKPGGGKARASGPTLVNPMAALFGPKAAAAPAPPPKAAKKPRDPAEVAKAEAAREAKLAKAKAEAEPLPPGQEVCFACGSGDDTAANMILLCDGSGCHAAFHMQCLERPLFSVPEGDWLCPSCESRQLAPPPEKLTTPHTLARRVDPERQTIDGCDLMGWARTLAASLPTSCTARDGPPERVPLSRLCGRACLYSADEGAPLRAGLVVDARFADPVSHRGHVCALLALAGRATPIWVALGRPPATAPPVAPRADAADVAGIPDGGQPPAAGIPDGGQPPAAADEPPAAAARPRLYVGGELVTVPQADDVYWPARLFHLLAPEAEEPTAAAAEAVVMLPSSPAGLSMGIVSPVVVGGAKAAGGKGRAPPPASTWSERLVGFDGGPTVMCRLFGARNEEEAMLSVPRAELRPFPRVLREAPLDSSNAPLVRARLAALEWAARHPHHSPAPATAPFALPPADPPVVAAPIIALLPQMQFARGCGRPHLRPSVC